MPLKDYAGIIIIISFFIFANIVFLAFYNDVWWDSSVYIGMGKYMFSSGKSGLWEESRPLIFPFMLGFGNLLSVNAIYFGRIVSIAFASLILFMTYRVGTRLFSKNTGLLAAFFTAFSFTFLFFSPNILTELPSTFFVLLAFYYFLESRFFLAGIFSGIAVMTRLFQLFTLIGAGLIFLLCFFRKPHFYRKLSYVVLGTSLVALPYFLLNYYIYSDMLLPFKVQSHLTKTTGWMLYREHGFYFISLFRENFFVVFLLALPFFFKRNYKFYALALTPLIYILLFSFVKHKEMRFMLVILPFIYLLLAYCMLQIYEGISKKGLAFGFFSLMAVAWLLMTLAQFKEVAAYKYQRDDEALVYFQDYLKNNKGKVWITNPLYSLYSDAKIDGLLYFYSSGNLIDFVNKNKGKADMVLFNNCDVPCPPAGLDPLCEESRKILHDSFSSLKKAYDKEISNCRYLIFERNPDIEKFT